MPTPRDGTDVARLLECISAHGPARSLQISEATGVDISSVTPLLASYVKSGQLVMCKVEVPGSRPQNEYRIGVGLAAEWKPLKFGAPRRPPRPGADEPRAEPVAQAPGLHTTAAEAAALQPQKFEVEEAEEVEAAPAPGEQIPDGHELGPVSGIRIRDANLQRKTADSAADGFTCALWSDGQLSMLIDGEDLTLTSKQTRHLIAYLDRMAQLPGEAA